MAKSEDLQNAFKAAFGHAPPITRRANPPNLGQTNLRLDPVLMIPIGRKRIALVLSETINGAPHWAEGDVAVAYLDHASTGWRPVHIWYEFVQTGSFGIPFFGQVRGLNFNGLPFFAGESEYCGMGACTSWYSLIGFNPDGPSAWGNVPASGSTIFWSFQTSLPDGQGLIGCGGYHYSSVISAPTKRGDVMRVTYTGWMIPGGTGQKRHNFHVSTEVFLAHGKLNFRPEVQIPNCGS
jgi:hypothetical protein